MEMKPLITSDHGVRAFQTNGKWLQVVPLKVQPPEVREAFPKIAEQSEQWAAIIKHWDELVEMFHAEAGENWAKKVPAPKTYDFMKKILKKDKSRITIRI
jgi:hypothetical protein